MLAALASGGRRQGPHGAGRRRSAPRRAHLPPCLATAAERWHGARLSRRSVGLIASKSGGAVPRLPDIRAEELFETRAVAGCGGIARCCCRL